MVISYSYENALASNTAGIGDFLIYSLLLNFISDLFQ